MHFDLSLQIVSDFRKNRYWPVILPSSRFYLIIWDKNALRALETGTRFTFPDSRNFAWMLAAWPHFQQIWTESELLCRLIVSRPDQQIRAADLTQIPSEHSKNQIFQYTQLNPPCQWFNYLSVKSCLLTSLSSEKKCIFRKLQDIYYCIGMVALNSKPQVSGL